MIHFPEPGVHQPSHSITPKISASTNPPAQRQQHRPVHTTLPPHSACQTTPARLAVLCGILFTLTLLLGVAPLAASTHLLTNISLLSQPTPPFVPNPIPPNAQPGLFGRDGSPTPNTLGAQTCSGSSRDSLGNTIIPADTWLCGDLRVYNGDATIEGRISGSVTILHGNVAIDGEVDGSVTTLSGDIDLRPGATIGGGVQALGGALHIARRATVDGPVFQNADQHSEQFAQQLGFGQQFVFPWAHLIFWILAALTVALVFPRQLALVGLAARSEPAQSAIVGTIVVVGAAVISVALFFTCFGIPIAILVLGALWLAWIIGAVALGEWLGAHVLHPLASERLSGAKPSLVTAVVGVALLSLINAIPVIGGILSIVLGCCGVGAVIIALFDARRAKRFPHPPRNHLRLT